MQRFIQELNEKELHQQMFTVDDADDVQFEVKEGMLSEDEERYFDQKLEFKNENKLKFPGTCHHKSELQVLRIIRLI